MTSKKSHKYLIVYDISKQRERTKVSKILSGYGQRVQESVFECRLSVGMRERLKKKLEKLEVETGFVLVYRLYDNAKKTAIGNVPEDINDIEEHAFVV
jgi:CRISPR-associated protein Cas2